MLFQARNFQFSFPGPTLIMGILNVTPDSFFDGGKHFDLDHAVAQGLRLVEEGAHIIDIGGESTRPGAENVSESEELRRVIPVITRLASQVSIPISIDTSKPGVARAAVEAGASIINDIAAVEQNSEMWKIVAESGAGYVCMHMQGKPRTMQVDPKYKDVVGEISEFFEEQIKALRACGVGDEQIVFDPGIGFGKTVEHNLDILKNLHYFSRLNRPLLLGVSRKSFIGKITGAVSEDRLPGS